MRLPLDLLTDPLIRYDTVDGTRVTASLPEVYADLIADNVGSFPALRPHQRHAWHAFLVQLGALALHQTGEAEPPADAKRWADLLRGLTRQYPQDEPWHLVVGDITRPAFLQPPATSIDREADYKYTVGTADELDILRTAKNQDLKGAVASGGLADDWLFALITVQTMDGFKGRDNYGISRMYGGFGNRPAFSLAPMGGVGAHVHRDTGALLARRDEVMEVIPRNNIRYALMWVEPWNGTKEEAMLPSELDPFYIEICRRIRLHVDSENHLQAKRANSKSTRVDAGQLKGMSGDPWTPINTTKGKALMVPRGGFTYRRIMDYLTPGDWKPPALLKPTLEELETGQDMRLVARGMVRGQGKTEGYYERNIPLRTRSVRAFATEGGLESIGEISKDRIKQIGVVQRVLRFAIEAFIVRGKADERPRTHKEIKKDRQYAEPWVAQLDRTVDEGFFAALQTEFESDSEDRPRVRQVWLEEIVANARLLLLDAAQQVPCRSVYRYRAHAAAETSLEAGLRGPKGLPFLFTEDKP